MPSRTALVTDSTAHLASGVARRLGIRVVPLQVVVDGQAREEGDGIGPGEVAAALRAGLPVSTSRPSPRAFLDVYQGCAADGARNVVSIHLSASLSGTADAARLAARDSPVPVTVVDSRSLGMGLGFAVLSAAQAVAAGRPVDEVAAVARTRAAGSSALFYVDTLDYLRRGGRIGAAAALLGTALAIKPLLRLRDGWIEPLEKVRTSSRARARLEDLAVHSARLSGPSTGEPVDVAVHHLDNARRAAELADRLGARLPRAGQIEVSEVGAVIGAHAGPGLLGVIVSPRVVHSPDAPPA